MCNTLAAQWFFPVLTSEKCGAPRCEYALAGVLVAMGGVLLQAG
jgi:hypothetical protein